MKKAFAVPLALLLLTGCSLTPDYQRPQVGTMQGWSATQAQQSPSIIASNWWSTFQRAATH